MVDEKKKFDHNCKSMPPQGGNWGCCSSSSYSMHSAKPEMLYKVWPGNNKFLCGGRLVLGPDAKSLYLSSFLIGCPAITFCVRMLVRIKEHGPIYGYGVFTLGCILTFLVITFLLLTSLRDPGIIPRNFRPPEEEDPDMEPPMEWGNSRHHDIRLPRTKDVKINGYTIKVKFCDTCLLYRPPRASHCSICNNCVQKFDHHCPWVGQCIGLRNYRYYILFISTSTLLCIYVFTFSLINILCGKKSVVNSMSDDVVSVILVIYCFVAVWFVGGLTIFHFYLMSTNQTTYENFRYRYDKSKNPHNLGYFYNVKQILFNRIPPSAINFREMVLVEDAVLPETPSQHGGYVDFNRRFDLEVGIKLAKNGSFVLPGPGAMQHMESSDSMKKSENGSAEVIHLLPEQKSEKGHHIMVKSDIDASNTG